MDGVKRSSVVARPLADPLVGLVANRFLLLGHPVRIGLIDRLDRLGELHVQALADELGATHQNTSKHLGVLWRAGLLARRQEGRLSLYSLADREAFPLIDRVATWISVTRPGPGRPSPEGARKTP